MNKPIETAPAPQPPVPAAPAAPWTLSATRLPAIALRWSADAALPTLLPGRVDLAPSVTVRFVTEGAR